MPAKTDTRSKTIFQSDAVCISPPPPPPHVRGYTRSIFQQSLACLNFEFFFLTNCQTKAKEPSLPYLSITEERKEVSMSLLRTK